MSSTSPTVEPWRTAIDGLTDAELDLLTVLVLEEDAASRNAWTEAANRYGLSRSPSHALEPKDLQSLCKRLIAAGALPQGRLHAATPVALHVLTTAHARGRLASLAESHERSQRRYRGFGRLHPASLRLAVLLGDPRKAAEAIDRLFTRDRRAIVDFLFHALGHEPHASWLPPLPDHARVPYLHHLVEQARTELRPLDPSLIEAALAEDDKKLRLDVARLLVLRGEGTRATTIRPLPRWGVEGIAVLAAFWRGNYAEAAALGDAAIAAMTGRKHKLLPDLEGACHMLAAVVTTASDPRSAARLGALVDAAMNAKGATPGFDLLLPISDLHDVLAGDTRTVRMDPPALRRVRSFSVCLVWLLHELWVHDPVHEEHEEAPPPKRSTHDKRSKAAREVLAPTRDAQRLALLLPLVRAWEARASEGCYAPVARELQAIATALEGGPRAYLAGAFDPPAPWEAALARLEAAIESTAQGTTAAAASSRRLLWALSVSDEGSFDLQPRILSSARASKGRALPLERLLRGDEAELLDDADRAVLATVEHLDTSWGGRRSSRPMLGVRAMLALIGHPRVISSSGAPLAVERGTPTIVSRRRDGHTRVELRPPALVDAEVVCQQPEPTRIVVYERPASLEPLAAVLVRDRGLVVPDAARDRLARTLARLGAAASVAVEGDLELGARTRPADPRPLLLLGWDGSALTVQVCAAPLGPGGPHLHPGTGTAALFGELSDEHGPVLARCQRDLALERSRHRALLDACPTLAGFGDAPLHHRAPSLPDALDVMLELDALGDEVVLAWTAGQALDRPLRADLRHLDLEVSSGTDWLSVSGTVQLDEGAVLRFADLLGKREGTRYVPLGRGRFVALSDRLRRHLDALGSLGPTKGGQLRASPALLSTLDELASEAEGLRFDDATRARIDALRELERWTPRLPRGFQATLREYQREGYVWLSRLARAGLGACLADDMGLGKTVQTLALLCQRARLGPAIVVCPTSVVLNWVAEATRFAPTLRLHVLAHEADRPGLLRALGPRDVVVCSYGLLTSEADALAELELATVVFDEAHALKNESTKRSRSARRLRAQFRLALTGTPVENHLGELWSLLDVIVPGLLGTRSHFTDRFTTPIAAGDRERTALLRAILRPFLLRRTKAQVLDELPPRTEITVRVEPYPRERAFYEALRRRAWDRVATCKPSEARFEILAQITRLRQAAIDPRLVDEAAGPEGAKIDALVERLEQLRDEGHRALVFTQFLGSMAVVRARLLAAGIELLELDGSTPAAERARRIEAFQAGEGDVFLLSLRAGGVGVNLTGADYVFHLDPWWNPAVEDQATDRAHRLGQRRPVTVYRLVTEGTIEDKILALHTSKRTLADDVLAGLEQAAVPDLDELRRLLEL